MRFGFPRSLSLIQKFLILVSIPLCFEVGLVTLLLDMQAKTEAESQRLERARQINSVVNQICRKEVKLEDILDECTDPMIMAREINQHFSAILGYFERLEVLTRPDQSQHATLLILLKDLNTIETNLRELRTDLIVNPDRNPVAEARQYAPVFKRKIRAIIAGGFLNLADNYAHVLDTDSSSNLRMATKKLLQLAVLISILIAVSSSVYVSQGLAKRLRHLATNARRLGNREFFQAEKSSRDELAQVDLAMQEAAQAIATLDKNREEIIGMVSHDIRSPVTTIKMASEMLADSGAQLSADHSKKMLLDIGNNCERILSISRDLLDLHRWEAGALVLELESVAIDDVVQNAMLAVQGAATKRSISLSFNESDLKLVADPIRLEQILTNLLTNAIKNSPPKSTVQIACLLQTGQRKVRVEVRDEGPGLPPGFEKQIFDRFVQGRDSDKVKGVGLGLAIARALTELHHGQISASNQKTRGSVFSVTLPLEQV